MDMINPVFQKGRDGQIDVYVYVKFYDEVAKVVQVSQYDLILEKEDNWKIVGVN